MASTHGKWADAYRKKWTWDRVTWGSHSVDCYPGGCSWRVYSKGGKVLLDAVHELGDTALPVVAARIADE